jgi:hypothetical protein
MDFGSIAMSSGGKEFEKYARDCALLANRVEKQEHRETLLEMAREWMQAAMEEDEERQVAPDQYGAARASRARQKA